MAQENHSWHLDLPTLDRGPFKAWSTTNKRHLLAPIG
jgi:hypothetical protein